MAKYDIGILNGKAYIDGYLVQKHIYIQGEKIVDVSSEIYDCSSVYDAKNKWVLPGFIDPHVHMELDVGEYTSADDFYSGSVAAAFGGITTIIDFLDPISKANELEEKLNARKLLAKKSVVDYAFHATVANPKGEVDAITNEMDRLNLKSVKLFTTYSDSDRRTYDDEIIQLLALSKERGFLVLAHIENDSMIVLDKDMAIKDLKISRPFMSEMTEALKLAGYAKDTDGRLYMVHLSSGNTLNALVNEYKDILGKNMYIESCPHYFYLNESVFKQNEGYLYLLAPPLRSQVEINKLKRLFAHVNTIGTDHCPFMSYEKDKSRLIGTPMGIGGVEQAFDLMYSLYGINAIDKMTTNTAKIYGLYPEKGSLEIGTDADIVIYNPDYVHAIEGGHSNCDYSVYQGQKVLGQVEATIIRGRFVMDNGELVTLESGKYLG